MPVRKHEPISLQKRVIRVKQLGPSGGGSTGRNRHPFFSVVPAKAGTHLALRLIARTLDGFPLPRE